MIFFLKFHQCKAFLNSSYHDFFFYWNIISMNYSSTFLSCIEIVCKNFYDDLKLLNKLHIEISDCDAFIFHIYYLWKYYTIRSLIFNHDFSTCCDVIEIWDFQMNFIRNLGNKIWFWDDFQKNFQNVLEDCSTLQKFLFQIWTFIPKKFEKRTKNDKILIFLTVWKLFPKKWQNFMVL